MNQPPRQERFADRVDPAGAGDKAPTGAPPERPRQGPGVTLGALTLLYLAQELVFFGDEVTGGAPLEELSRRAEYRGLDGLVGSALEGASPLAVAEALVAGLGLFLDGRRPIGRAASAAGSLSMAHARGEDLAAAWDTIAGDGAHVTSVASSIETLYRMTREGETDPPPHLIAFDVVDLVGELVDEDELRAFALRVLEAVGEMGVFRGLRPSWREALPLYEEAARERQAHGQTAPGKNASGNLSGSVDARDEAGRDYGVSAAGLAAEGLDDLLLVAARLGCVVVPTVGVPGGVQVADGELRYDTSLSRAERTRRVREALTGSADVREASEPAAPAEPVADGWPPAWDPEDVIGELLRLTRGDLLRDEAEQSMLAGGADLIASDAVGRAFQAGVPVEWIGLALVDLAERGLRYVRVIDRPAMGPVLLRMLRRQIDPAHTDPMPGWPTIGELADALEDADARDDAVDALVLDVVNALRPDRSGPAEDSLELIYRRAAADVLRLVAGDVASGVPPEAARRGEHLDDVLRWLCEGLELDLRPRHVVPAGAGEAEARQLDGAA